MSFVGLCTSIFEIHSIFLEADGALRADVDGPEVPEAKADDAAMGEGWDSDECL